MAGITQSADLLTTPRVFQSRLHGPSDAFIAKFNSSAKQVLYSTYFGGAGEDQSGFDGNDLGVDSQGNAWLVGQTNSKDLPLHQAHQPQYGGGILDGFIMGLAPDGSTLRYSSYHGGEDHDFLEGLSLVWIRMLYATGLTASRNLNIVGSSVQQAHGSAKFNAMIVGLAIPTGKTKHHRSVRHSLIVSQLHRQGY